MSTKTSSNCLKHPYQRLDRAMDGSLVFWNNDRYSKEEQARLYERLRIYIENNTKSNNYAKQRKIGE